MGCPQCGGTSTGAHWPNCSHYSGPIPASYGGKLSIPLVEREAQRLWKELYGSHRGTYKDGLEHGIEVMKHAIRRAQEGK